VFIRGKSVPIREKSEGFEDRRRITLKPDMSQPE
jgi:hypothetical protein